MRVMGFDGYITDKWRDGIRIFTKDSFYSGVSAIAQDFVSYSLTMRENATISDLSRLHDDNAIKTALTNAGVDESVGLDEMMVREFGGKELSGGQWQKLAIARGLFKNSAHYLSPCRLV